MWSKDRSFPARGFSTPQPKWNSRWQSDYPVRPKSDGRRMSPVVVDNKGDLFHVIHKVPSGDSPYVKAKHVQLIEKDPSRAISLFWAAINSGDRVDSALKDMAVVMKQLDRADEAVEAIKSFRHLCPSDSQDSIDNLLVELFKRSGRIEEEIEMLERKLKHIEEGIAFGGKRTKTARSQGKKIQITMEQEISRILGNLAWAYLQKNKYEIAEQYYRKALSLELDKNKQCNLAICLMKMNRITEAKCLLQTVRASCGRQMDESYAKSFERAFQMLTELEEDNHKNIERPFMTPLVNRKLKEVNEGNHVLYTQPRPWRNSAQVKDKAAMQFLSQPIVNGDWRDHAYARVEDEAVKEPDSQLIKVVDNTVSGNVESTETDMEECFRGMASSKSDSLHPKSWADMAEEEEQEELLSGRKPTECFDKRNSEEEFNNENLNSNISPWPENHVETINRKPGNGNDVSSKNPSVRRSLCFDQHQKSVSENLKRRNRLQVFRDITPFPDSP